jgi:hypothetical protein
LGYKSGLQLSNNSIKKKHMDLKSGLPLATDTFTDTVLSLLFTSASYIYGLAHAKLIMALRISSLSLISSDTTLTEA